MVFVLLCFLIFGEIKTEGIDLRQFGFNDANFINFHGVGDRILAVSMQDNRVGLIDPSGKLIANLKPDETDALYSPMVLGVTDAEILLVFNIEKVKAFDHELKPLSSTYPPLPKRLMSGTSLGKNQFLLNTFAIESHALTHIALEDGTWHVKRELFPMVYQEGQPEGQPPAPKFWMVYHHGRVFVWRPLILGEDSYQVDVYAIGDQGEAEQVLALQNNIDNIKNIEGHWPLLMSASRFGKKFAVGFLYADPKTYTYVSRWVDIFSERGDLLERRELGTTMSLKPLAGDNRILTLDSETMILKNFQ